MAVSHSTDEMVRPPLEELSRANLMKAMAQAADVSNLLDALLYLRQRIDIAVGVLEVTLFHVEDDIDGSSANCLYAAQQTLQEADAVAGRIIQAVAQQKMESSRATQ
jgi:hypothetical protein